jgi:sigma-54 dependent transcriptional regulator, acetoin dehydrogenase operon transcriptional activator AcoR
VKSSLLSPPSPLLADSWRRSRAYGLARTAVPSPRLLAASELAARRQAHALLLASARPLIEYLHMHLARSASLVLLADPDGVVLSAAGCSQFLARAAGVCLQPGADWSEAAMGTNAIGTALVVGDCVEVLGTQHYLERNAILNCIATPIRAPGGGVLGVVDIACDARVVPTHAAAMLEMAAAMIEERCIEALPQAAVVLRLRCGSEKVPYDGLLAFDVGGRLLAANRRLAPLVASGEFATLFATPWLALIEHARQRGDEPLALITQHGEHCHARVGLRGAALAGAARSSRPASRTDSWIGDDARVVEAMRRARRIAGSDIPLLVQGETGSGKEWFVQACHAAGTRRDGPFVAVNCAAIPASLIEVELFGYVEGAFTGARRSGARGKFREADGGTLFLDEIGDMPLNLQAVLLRVLESRCVTPLGGEYEEVVDLTLVCASHQDLRLRVEQGLFRADLFFRLSGMTICLPPLRERSDFEALVRRILAEESPLRPIRVDPLALQRLRAYAWPGNLRQLRNFLRLSIALIGDDGVLDMAALTGDMLEAQNPATGLRAAQHRLVQETLARHGGNISAAARELGITRTTLYRKLGKAGA